MDKSCLLLVIILIRLGGKNLFPFDDEIYFLAEAVAWLITYICIYKFSVRYTQIIAMFMVLCQTFNVFDEIFFQAWTLSLDKYIFGLGILLYSSYQGIRLYLKENNLYFSLRKLKLIRN